MQQRANTSDLPKKTNKKKRKHVDDGSSENEGKDLVNSTDPESKSGNVENRSTVAPIAIVADVPVVVNVLANASESKDVVNENKNKPNSSVGIAVSTDEKAESLDNDIDMKDETKPINEHLRVFLMVDKTQHDHTCEIPIKSAMISHFIKTVIQDSLRDVVYTYKRDPETKEFLRDGNGDKIVESTSTAELTATENGKTYSYVEVPLPNTIKRDHMIMIAEYLRYHENVPEDLSTPAVDSNNIDEVVKDKFDQNWIKRAFDAKDKRDLIQVFSSPLYHFCISSH